jgi:diguanylate cyclase (GGDEF)-like protein
MLDTTQDAKLHDESGRVMALRRYEVLDTPDESQFERITSLVTAVLKVPICTVSLVDTDRQWFKSCIGLTFRQTPRETSFCTHTIRRRRPLMVPDALKDSRFMHYPIVTGEPFVRSYLGAPLCTPDGYNVGTICVYDHVPREFREDEIAVLTSFASLVVDELELRRIAQIDHLTGASTRRNFQLEMEKAMTDRQRTGRDHSLVLFDLDHFKRINDTHGHPVGDLVLQEAVRRIQHAVRPSDTVGRLGGEEFAVLLRETGLDDALKLADRLRRSLAERPVLHTPEVSMTASFGAATLQDIETAETWLARADEALYEAKRSGRNRCCAAEAMASTA